MSRFHLHSDRVIDSTDNNEYSEGLRDETISEEYLIDTDVPVDDAISQEVSDTPEGERPLYDEQGYDEERVE
jgi:hypothetical protein